MTQPRVTGLRSIEYGMPDIKQAAGFFEECWGLAPVATADGAVYLRASGPEHHIVVVRQSPKAGHVRVNLAAPDKATVDALHAHAEGLGVDVLGAPAPISEPGGGYGFAFRDPDKHEYRVLADVARHADARMEADRPNKLSHVVFNSNRVEDETRWFCDSFGFKLSDRTARMDFMRCSRDHHSMAFANFAGPSLNHVAYEVPDLDALMRGSARMKKKGFKVEWGLGRHGPGNNIFTYFIEPNGMVCEYTTEVDQVDDSYKTGYADDWKKRVQGPDRWGFSPPASERLHRAMSGIVEAYGVDAAA